MASEIVVQASMDTEAVYGVKKCAQMVFKKGKMVKGKVLWIMEERMKAIDPEQEVYKFLGCEQTAEIDTERVMEKIEGEVKKRSNMI